MEQTPLQELIDKYMQGRIKTAEKLLALGSDPSIQNEWGQIPMDVAIIGRHPEIAKLLKRHKKLHT